MSYKTPNVAIAVIAIAAVTMAGFPAKVEAFLPASAYVGSKTSATPRRVSFNFAVSKQQQEQQDELLGSNGEYFARPAGSKSQEYSCKYISSNVWPRSSQGRKLKKKAARTQLHGVEIRRLKEPHPLTGELGLFAAIPFQLCDIVGEYCGLVFDQDDGGHYATYLEDRTSKYALGVDARLEGNECRYINHYKGIAAEPNVIMKIAFIDELPRVLIVSTRGIEVGEEFLLQYSDEYVQEYIG